MRETERIVDLLERTFTANAWYGPSVKEALTGVDAAKASARPIQSAHTIWELVLHTSAWTEVIRQRLEGKAVTEPEEGDFPPVSDTSEAAWKKALDQLEARHKALVACVKSLDESKLEGLPFDGAKASSYIHLHGAAHHYIYHAGQITLLKKALG